MESEEESIAPKPARRRRQRAVIDRHQRCALPACRNIRRTQIIDNTNARGPRQRRPPNCLPASSYTRPPRKAAPLPY